MKVMKYFFTSSRIGARFVWMRLRPIMPIPAAIIKKLITFGRDIVTELILCRSSKVHFAVVADLLTHFIIECPEREDFS